MKNVLEIQNLTTSFFTHIGEVQSVRGVDITVGEGETIGIVGESGCGKSVTMMSIMGLLDGAGRVKAGSAKLDDLELIGLPEKEMGEIRGEKMSMIFQDPMTSLNPVFTVGKQMTEHQRFHEKISQKEADARAIKMLSMVGIPEPARRMKQYPHEFSGGMRQRVMIAMALVTKPRLLIADEPTTALDVTIQAQILALLKDLNKSLGTAIILITHDLGIVANITRRVYVMYGGKVMETATTESLYARPAHPYTRGLMRSIPNPESEEHERLQSIEGSPPDLLAPPKGCPFAPRCPQAMSVCAREMPPFYAIAEGHRAACFLYHPNRKGSV